MPAIGLNRDQLRFRLYLKSAEPGFTQSRGMDDPFVSLHSEALPFKAYLARLVAGDTVLIPHVALLISPNEYPGVRAGAPVLGANNLQMEHLWTQAVAGGRLRSPGVARIESRAFPGNLVPDDVPAQGPLAFCRKTEAYVEPLCPSCLSRLSLCRDEARLRTAGLPAYATTLSRYLYCATCAEGSDPRPVFYTYSSRSVESLAPGVKVRRRTELYRDLAPAIQTGRKPAGAEHHCFECPHRDACYPAGRSIEDRIPAEDLLVPLAYYGCFYLPVEPSSFDLGDAVAVLGGASPDEVQAQASLTSGPTDPLRAGELAQLSFDAGPQYFFHGDATGLFGLEVFHLKMSAFAGLARGVLEMHESLRRPHLALSPGRLRGGLSAFTPNVPARWGFGLRLGDWISTAPLIAMERDAIPGEPVVWSIPYPLPEAFVPDGESRIQSESLFMRLTTKDARSDTVRGQKTLRITADLVADSYTPKDHGRYDLVRLSAEAGKSQLGRLVFGGLKVDTIPRGFVFQGSTPPLSADASGLDPAQLPSTWSVEATIWHNFGPPCDVYSLGLALFRLLLQNDGQPGERLGRDVVERLAEFVRTGGDEAAERKKLAEALAREAIKAGVEQVLFREADRLQTRPAIPDGLWHDALLLALKMASFGPGWSVCSGTDDYDPADPGGPLRKVVEELEILAERARGALVGSSGRNGAVLEVCDDFLEDVKSWARAPAPPEASMEMTQVSPMSRRKS